MIESLGDLEELDRVHGETTITNLESGRFERAISLANRLKATIRECSVPEAQIDLDAWWGDGSSLVDIRCAGVPDEHIQIREIADGLDRELSEIGYRSDQSVDRIGRLPALHLGFVKINLPHRRILRGYLRPSMVAPIAIEITERVMVFLIELPGGDHLLHRDNHGQ